MNIVKPQNLIENPIYPDIKKEALLFKNARKHWRVDYAHALKETEKYPMFMENIIERQSRNRNETMYGKSAHRDYVNLEVRYPMISPIDLMPTTRRPRRPVVPHVNPKGPTQIYQDRMFNGIFGHTTDRVKNVFNPNFKTFDNTTSYNVNFDNLLVKN